MAAPPGPTYTTHGHTTRIPPLVFNDNEANEKYRESPKRANKQTQRPIVHQLCEETGFEIAWRSRTEGEVLLLPRFLLSDPNSDRTTLVSPNFVSQRSHCPEPGYRTYFIAGVPRFRRISISTPTTTHSWHAARLYRGGGPR